MTDNVIIRTTAELEAACAVARERGVLAIDTEFVWMRTYAPQLGIVQIGADEDHCWAVDCMTALDNSALKALVEDASVVKILHAAKEDLQLVHRYTGALPRNVFDTQIAAAFADFPAGIGLQKLLQDALEVGLAKTETRTDWTQRPLSDAQVRYALDDVRYLPELRLELLRRADAFGTRAWLEEEFVSLEDRGLYVPRAPEEMWTRIKTRRARLDGRGFAILRAVAAVREETARKWNLPRNWLGDDGSLVAMAERGEVGRLQHRLHGGQGDTVKVLYAAAIRSAAELPEEECPSNPNPRYISEVLDAADAALDWLDGRSAELHVAPQAIANRATVTAFVDDVTDESNPLASGWRYEAVGRDMAEKFGVD